MGIRQGPDPGGFSFVAVAAALKLVGPSDQWTGEIIFSALHATLVFWAVQIL